MSLCFVEYVLHDKGKQGKNRFSFTGALGTNAARTLGGLLARGSVKWIHEMFGTRGKVHTIQSILWRRGCLNLAGRSGDKVRIQLNERFLPASRVKIFWDGGLLEHVADLQKLAALLKDQWRPHRKLPAPDEGNARPQPPASERRYPLPTAHHQETKNSLAGAQNDSSPPSPALLYPFRPIEEVDHLFRTSGVSPSREEFIKEKVHRSALFPRVVACLERASEAVIVGDGASGKTTLALQVAFDRIKTKLPVFYLDINEVTTSHQDQQAVAASSIAARHRCLLILDNAHLNGSLASAICHEWERERTTSQLLMVSREAQENSSLTEWMQTALRLTVSEQDLVGALGTIARRFSLPQHWEQSIHPDLTSEWAKAFGGNLVAFTIAATDRIEALRKGEMDLGPEDARGWVDSHYLDPIEAPLSEKERRGLLRLAVLGQFEIRVPKHFLGDRLRQSQRSGAAHEILDFQRENSEFVLTHAALGKLLLAAASKEEVDSLSVLRAFMDQCPDRADNMVHAVLLGSEGEAPSDPTRDHAHYGVTRVDARQLFREWIASPNWRGLEASSLDEHVSRLTFAGFDSEEPLMDQAFLRLGDQLIASAFQGWLVSLLQFLVSAETILPRTHAMLLKEFRSPHHRSELISLMLQSHGVSADDFERLPRTKTEKFQHWLLDEALTSSDSQAVLDFIWSSNLRAAGGWLKRLRKASGVTKFKQLLNHPTSVKLATNAFFNHTANSSDGNRASSTCSLTEVLRLIRREMPKEMMSFFSMRLSDVAVRTKLAARLSDVPKDEPGLKTLWKELADFIPAKQLHVIKRSVVTKDGEKLLQEHGKPMTTIKKASSS